MRGPKKSNASEGDSSSDINRPKSNYSAQYTVSCSSSATAMFVHQIHASNSHETTGTSNAKIKSLTPSPTAAKEFQARLKADGWSIAREWSMNSSFRLLIFDRAPCWKSFMGVGLMHFLCGKCYLNTRVP